MANRSGSRVSLKPHMRAMGLGAVAAILAVTTALAQATPPAQPPAAVSGDEAWQSLVELADLAISAGRYEEATRILERAIAIRSTPSLRLKLAELQAQLGEKEAAMATLDALGRDRATDGATRVEALTRLGNLATQQHQAKRAARAFEAAFVTSGRANPELLRALVTSLDQAGQEDRAIGVLRDTVRSRRTTGPELLAQAREGLVARLIAADRRTEAIEVLQGWAATGRAPASALKQLGILLQQEKRCAEAVPILTQAVGGEGDAEMRIYLAICLQQLHRPDQAIEQLRTALASPTALEPQMRYTAYATLGYLYAQTGRPADAARAWSAALELQPSATLTLERARALRLAEDLPGARAALTTLNPERLMPSERALYYDELAALETTAGSSAGTIAALEAGMAMGETAERRGQLGTLQAEAGDKAAAEANLRRAAELEPDNPQRHLALAYLYRAQGRDAEAVPEFDTALRLDPAPAQVHADLGYALVSTAENDQAALSFREAIDRASAEAAPQAAPPLERERQLYGWRREVAQLESTVTGSAYYVHAPDVSSPSDSANPVGDQFPASGAGAELAYRPPKIGFRDGRTLQLFGRVFWTAEDGPAPEGDTVQAGLGVRYKPFASQNLVLSGERLVAIGSDARNDWLLRAGYSFSSSADLEPGRDRANYTSLYADAAVIPTSELPLFLTGELIQGISFNALPQTAVIPHLLAAGNLVDDEGGNSSGLYVGLGLRLKAWPLETKYQAGRIALTMDVQYRQQVVGNRDDSGVVVRLVAGF